jgi:hypothetical protein
MPNHIHVELVYDAACPHIEPARTNIRGALAVVGVHLTWIEWDRASIDTPHDRRQLASPTVLVNGRDVVGDDTMLADASACRVYLDAGELLSGAPPMRAIADAIRFWL